MTQLTNKHTSQLNVQDKGKVVSIGVGETVDVDGRSDWSKNLFVKAGWLVVEDFKEDPTVKADADKKAKAEDESKK